MGNLSSESGTSDRFPLKGRFLDVCTWTLDIGCDTSFEWLCCLLGRDVVLSGTFLCSFLCASGEGRSLVENRKRLPLRGVIAGRFLEWLSLLVCVISVSVCNKGLSATGDAGGEACKTRVVAVSMPAARGHTKWTSDSLRSTKK